MWFIKDIAAFQYIDCEHMRMWVGVCSTVAMWGVADVWFTIPDLQGVTLVLLQQQQLLQNTHAKHSCTYIRKNTRSCKTNTY